jgi:hypothetical protein
VGIRLAHLGIGEVVAKSSLTKPNENRSYLIYQELAMSMIKEAKQLYLSDNDFEVPMKGNVFAIDATTIDLCYQLFTGPFFEAHKEE